MDAAEAAKAKGEDCSELERQALVWRDAVDMAKRVYEPKAELDEIRSIFIVFLKAIFKIL